MENVVKALHISLFVTKSKEHFQFCTIRHQCQHNAMTHFITNTKASKTPNN